MSFKVRSDNYLINVTIFNRAFYKQHLKLGRMINLMGKYDKEKNSFTASDIKFELIKGVKIEPVYHLVKGVKSSGLAKLIQESSNNIKLTIITLNDPNEYDTHQYLYKKMYSKYKLYKLIDKNNYQISKDIYKNNYQISKDFSYLLSEEERKNVKIDVIIDKQENTQTIGYLKITLNDKIIGIVDIYENTQKKEEMNFFQKISNYLLDILKKFMLGLQNSLKPGPVVPIPLEIYKSVALTL